MEKICCNLSIAGMKLRILSDCELPFQDCLTEFYSDFDSSDMVYTVCDVNNPDDFIPKTAKEIYSGAGVRIFELDGQLYHRYSYGGELSVLHIGEGNTVYVSAHELSPINIHKSLALETRILDFDGIFMHASLVKAGDRGIAFSAPSGVGKSTQAALWQKHRGAKILNGDRAAIRIADEGCLAYGSPWAGSSGIYHNDFARLSAIVFLSQGAENTVTRLSGARAFGAVMKGGILPYWSKDKMSLACNIAERILSRVPVFELSCRPDLSAVEELEKYI
ncbi:MAG: hypothetical protein IKY44_03090 [Clostridia bacterium]|nr:hypothetical protein [Clostridia bacterium]